jgi:vacuolar-type H+-ATPase subunit I/STV1
MAKEVKRKSIGAWAFLIGVVLALIMGVINSWLSPDSNLPTVAVALLIIAGIIIGFLNINGKETLGFLLAALALVIVSSFGGDALTKNLGSLKGLGTILGDILGYLLVLFVPTTIVVALKSVFAITKD